MKYGAFASARIAFALDQAVLVALTGSAWMTDWARYMIDQGYVNGSGSNAAQGTIAGLGGADPMTATTDDGSTITETVVGLTNWTNTIARQGMMRSQTDMAVFTANSSDLDPDKLAADMIESYWRRFNTMVLTAGGTATSVVGQAGVGCKVDDILDAMFELQNTENQIPFFCKLDPHQLSNFQNSLRDEVGALGAFNEATVEMIKAKGPGTAGTWNNIEFATVTGVPQSGADYVGVMMAAGALGLKRGKVDPKSFRMTALAVQQDNLTVEFARRGTASTLDIIGTAYLGVSLIQDGKIVKIRTT